MHRKIRLQEPALALKEFVNDALDLGDDITHFENYKKSSREKGLAEIGIKVQNPFGFDRL